MHGVCVCVCVCVRVHAWCVQVQACLQFHLVFVLLVCKESVGLIIFVCIHCQVHPVGHVDVAAAESYAGRRKRICSELHNFISVTYHYASLVWSGLCIQENGPGVVPQTKLYWLPPMAQPIRLQICVFAITSPNTWCKPMRLQIGHFSRVCVEDDT